MQKDRYLMLGLLLIIASSIASAYDGYSWLASEQNNNNAPSDYPNGGCFRNLISKTFITHDTTTIVVNITAGTGPVDLATCSICEKGAGNANCVVGTLKSITWGGANIAYIPTGTSLLSDELAFTFTNSKDYWVTYCTKTGSANTSTMNWACAGGSCGGEWYNVVGTGDQETWVAPIYDADRVIGIGGILYVSGGGGSVVPLQVDLVGYYPFDIDMSDSHTSHIDGTAIAGAVINTTSKKLGTGSLSSYNGYMNSSNGTAFDWFSRGTVNMWVSTNPFSGTFKGLANDGYDSCNPADEWALEYSSSSVFDGIIGSRGNTPQEYHVLDGSLTGNGWEMLTLRYNGSNLTMFVNGTKVATTYTTISIAPSRDNASFVIGASKCGADYLSHTWPGLIDEVGVWSRDLTEPEISNLFNNGYGFAYPFLSNCSYGTTEYLYQESTNVSTEWGGLDTGTYTAFCYNGTDYVENIYWNTSNPFGNTVDGDYSTYGELIDDKPFYFCDVNVTYMKPTGALNTSLWQVKDGNSTFTTKTNLTLQQDCWNAYPDKLIFQFSTGNSPTTDWACYNGTVFASRRSFQQGKRVYEEGMWWNVNTSGVISTNLSASLTLDSSPIPSFPVKVYTNFFNTSAHCYLIFTGGVNCTDFDVGTCTTVSLSTCQPPQTLMESTLTAKVVCDNGVNSTSQSVFLDTNSNPSVNLNLLSVYNSTPGYPFESFVYANSWVETPSCSAITNTSIIQCSVSSFQANGTRTYNGTLRCVSTNFTQIWFSVYATCNGTNLYRNINSSVFESVYDATGPIFVFKQFNGNDSWFSKNITGRFDFYDINLYRFNVTIDGASIFSQVGINSTNYTYILNHYVGDLIPGYHNITLSMTDSHTKKSLEGTWDVGKSLFGDSLEFNVITKAYKKNKIIIQTLDKEGIMNPFDYQKQSSKFTFTFHASTAKNKYSFKVKSDLPIHIIDRPDLKWKQWAISGDNWIDFYDATDSQMSVKIKRIDDYTVTFEVKDKKNPLTQQYSSIGEINTVSETYYFYTYNATLTYQPNVMEGQTEHTNLTINYGTVPPPYNASLSYNGANVAFLALNVSPIINLASLGFFTPAVNETKNVSGYWWFNTSIENNTFQFSQVVTKINISINCSNSSFAPTISFYGRDEVSDANVTFDMNIQFTLWTDTETIVSNIPFELRAQDKYDLCIYPNDTMYHMSAILEYMATSYSPRKYYLYNTSLSSSHQDVYLYLLNETLATPITAQVLDSLSTVPIKGALIRVLRFYPGRTQSYSQVEIAQTDNQGKTLLKMQTLDTFYKFIIEYPVGTVKLETDVQKILTGTKTFLIKTEEITGLEVWNRIQDMSVSITCTESSKTCRLTWANQGLTARAASLYVYEQNGYDQQLLFNQTVYSSAGSIVYTVPNYQNNTLYLAQGNILGYDDTLYPAGTAQLYTEAMPFSATLFRLASLFPFLLIFITLSAALLDFGTVGVTIGCLLSLIIGWIAHILPFDYSSAIGLIIMGGVLIFKLSKE